MRALTTVTCNLEPPAMETKKLEGNLTLSPAFALVKPLNETEQMTYVLGCIRFFADANNLSPLQVRRIFDAGLACIQTLKTPCDNGEVAFRISPSIDEFFT